MRRNRRRQRGLLSILGVAVLLSPACSSQEAPSATAAGGGPGGFVPDTKPVPEARWLEVTVPKGTPLKLSLIDTLTSQTGKKGDRFRALVTEAILLNGVVAVPSGSNVLGTIEEIVSPSGAGGAGATGTLALGFDRIDTPTGASAPLKARLSEIAPGKSGLVVAKGGKGDVVTAGEQGREAILGSNTPLTIVLEEPLLIKVKQ